MSEYLYDETLFSEEFSSHNKKILRLTRNEALFIDDSLTMIIEREQGDERITTVRPLQYTGGLPSPVDLLEKIALAILFTTDPENEEREAEIPVSDTDLFMLREIAHSYVKVGEEPVGFNIKKKIYNLLYKKSYEREKVARSLITQLDTISWNLDDVKSEDIKNSPEI